MIDKNKISYGDKLFVKYVDIFMINLKKAKLDAKAGKTKRNIQPESV